MSDEDYTQRDYALDDPDSVQSGSVSSTVNEKKDGVEWTPKPSDSHEADKSSGEDGSGDFGIPAQFSD